jgi:toxin ParE1/3/4
MPSRIHERRRARADLDSIWSYIAADNNKAANALLDRIGTVYEMLVRSPLAGRRRPNLGKDLRSFAVENFVVFYRPRSYGIEVVRVVHGRQDIKADDLK